VVTAAFTSAAAPRALQDALDPAQLIEMCATGGSDAVAKAVNEMYADVGSGSIDENVPMIIDGPATGRCICSDTFSASTMTALVDGSDPTAALQVMCTADCRGLLDMTFAGLGAMLGAMGGDGMDVGALMGSMTSCMCETPAVMSMIAGVETGDLTTPGADELESLCSSASCSGLLGALTAGMDVCSGLSGSFGHDDDEHVDNTPVVLYTATVSGSLDDITDSQRATVKSGIAKAAQVRSSQVTVTYVAGSVEIYAIISVPDGTNPTDISSNLNDNLGTNAAASSSLGLPVQSTSVEVTTASTASIEVVEAVEGSIEGAIKKAVALGTGLLIVVIVVPILVILIIVFLSVYCCCCKNKQKVVGTTSPA